MLGTAATRCPCSAREEAEVADADESVRQDVENEASDELAGGDAHGARAVARAAVAVEKPNLAVAQGDQSVVGDRHAVGVAAEIVQSLLGCQRSRFSRGIGPSVITIREGKGE